MVISFGWWQKDKVTYDTLFHFFLCTVVSTHSNISGWTTHLLLGLMWGNDAEIWALPFSLMASFVAKVWKSARYWLGDGATVLNIVFINCIAANHLGVSKMIWLDFWGANIVSLFAASASQILPVTILDCLTLFILLTQQATADDQRGVGLYLL